MTKAQGESPGALALHGVEIVDTYAEAFSIRAARVIITADHERWAHTAATVMCGNATSLIVCDVEAAIEGELADDDTPDGRPGISVLVFGYGTKRLGRALRARIAQCVMTCPTTACYNGLSGVREEDQVRVGGGIRYYGDGFQKMTQLDERAYWRIPVMDGEFLCEDRFGTVKGVAGGHLLIGGTNTHTALAATEAAAQAIRTQRDIALPFPGGFVRSGSKMGSRYSQLKASTNDPYCPTLRRLTATKLPDNCHAVYEVIIDGLSYEAVKAAMQRGLHAAAAQPGVVMITAGNYEGNLGEHRFYLRDLL
jgi:formylmethanofuran--tetrahydromethanopterin N-formyltransferase